MADVKISNLPPSSVPLAGTEVLPIVQGGTTKKVSVNDLTAGKSVSALDLTVTGLTASKPVFTDANDKLTSSGTVPVDQGGTGITTVAQGDLLYASGANTIVALAKNTTATRYLANTGTSNNPAWAQVNLTNGVTGTLPTGNGGTGITGFTANAVLYATSTTALTGTGTLFYNGTTLCVGSNNAYGGNPNISAFGNIVSLYANGSTLGTYNGIGFANYAANAGIFAAGIKAINDTTVNTMGIGFFTSADGNAGTEKARFSSSGGFYLEVDVTTASAANMFIDTTTTPAGLVKRSTSSSAYKTAVETIDPKYSEALLQARPVWYRSLCENDRKDWSWYGLIAEELAEIEPRLVHWGYVDEDFEWLPVVSKSKKFVDGVETEVEEETLQKTLKKDAKIKPNGVQYERVSVLLLDIVQRQDKLIKDISARLEKIETAS